MKTLEHSTNHIETQNLDVALGIESHDKERAQFVSESILANHMPQYDNYVGAAHDFVKNTLGMTDVQAAERTAVLSSEIATQWGVETEGGQYLPEVGIAYVFEPADISRPKTAKLALASGLVHELAHSASVTTETAQTEHGFFNEGIAGLAEYFALQNLANAGEYDVPPDFTVNRDIDGEEVNIAIPGSFRRVDAAETIEGKADTTQALIAAMGIGIGLKRTGKKATDILDMTRKDNSAAYTEIKAAVEAIEPGFVDFIAAQPNTTDGIIKIAQRAQQAVGIPA